MKPAAFVWTGDWSTVPGTLTKHHLAAIYARHWKTIDRFARTFSREIPSPDFLKPYRWKKARVQAHYEAQNQAEQLRQRMGVAS